MKRAMKNLVIIDKLETKKKSKKQQKKKDEKEEQDLDEILKEMGSKLKIYTSRS